MERSCRKRWNERGEIRRTRKFNNSMTKILVLRSSARLLGSIVFIALLQSSLRAADTHEQNPGAEGDGKFTIGPEYRIDPDLTERGNPKGKSFEFTKRLGDS